MKRKPQGSPFLREALNNVASAGKTRRTFAKKRDEKAEFTWRK